MQQKYLWRSMLGLYIGERAGAELKLGDLFNLFGGEIPLELASRRWHSRHHELDLNELMRWDTFSNYCRQLNLAEPKVSKGLEFTKSTIIVGRAVNCLACGKPFCAMPIRKYCSYECGQKWDAARIERSNHHRSNGKKPSPPTTQPQQYKAQIIAINIDPLAWDAFKKQNNRLGVSIAQRVEQLIAEALREDDEQKIRLIKAIDLLKKGNDDMISVRRNNNAP